MTRWLWLGCVGLAGDALAAGVDRDRAEALSSVVARQDVDDLGPLGVDPGSERFVGEWRFGVAVTGAAGHAQVGLLYPELAEQQAARASAAVDLLVDDATWAFDEDAWGDLALHHLGDDAHDHGVLGYAAFAMGLERLLDPDNRHAATHDAVVAALVRRVGDSERAGPPLLQTYPGEGYPVDHAATIAAIALHARATGVAPPPWLERHLDRYAARFVDPRGLRVQAVDPATGAARGPGRGSGSALAAYFLGYARPELSRAIGEAVRDELGDTLLGLAAVREYPPELCASGHPCAGDVDSGPLILGASMSATGFALASAVRLDDDAWFDGLYRTASVFGLPGRDGGYTTGGALGNAILLAMLTPLPLEG